MTIKVRIENQGNQPGDTLLIRGLKEIGKDTDGTPWVEQTNDPKVSVALLAGDAVVFSPSNTGHFDDFETIHYKAKL